MKITIGALEQILSIERSSLGDTLAWSQMRGIATKALGQARAEQAEPSQPTPRLYRAMNNLLSHIGYDGKVDSDHPFVHEAIDALHEIDGGIHLETFAKVAPQPAQAVPAGWMLMPVGPTQTMLAELFRGYATREAAYAAMPKAAPQPPADHFPDAGKMVGNPAAQVAGLTDAEILNMAEGCTAQYHDLLDFARATIAEFCRVNGIKPPEKGGAV